MPDAAIPVRALAPGLQLALGTAALRSGDYDLALGAGAWRLTRQLLVEFGMTPSSRTRVKVATPVVEDAGTEWWERSG